MIRQFGADTAQFDWTQTDTRSSLLCGIAIFGCLAVGILSGHQREGMNAAYGAMSVAFGSFQLDRNATHTSRFLASLAMALSILVGGLVGKSLLASIVAVAVWGMANGLLISLSTESSWIGIQGSVDLFLAIAYVPAGGQSGQRSLYVLLGGLLQSLALYLFCKTGVMPGCGLHPLEI